jgi:putative PIN family toxin of toxin-antitoxin system
MERSDGVCRLVLDTNVWLDWLVFADASVQAIRTGVQARQIEIVMNPPCRDELERALGYPMRGEVAPADVQALWMVEALGMVRQIKVNGASAASRLPRCHDPGDQKFLELALDASADFLVTRDKALLVFARRRFQPLPFRVLTPLQFSEAHSLSA